MARRAASAEVTVYFATNRMPLTKGTGEAERIVDFGPDLGPVDGTSVRFGSAQVAFRGGVATMLADTLHVAPEKLYGLDQRRGSRDIFGRLREDMKEGGRPTLVTVHGFSNSFQDAIERAATIRSFYGLDANVFAFTWPSRNSGLPIPLPYVDYVHDRATARASGVAMARTMRILYDFMDSLGPDQACRQPLHLICHSMGVYAFRHAVQALMRQPIGEALAYAPATDAPPTAPPEGFPALVGLPTEDADPNRLRRTFGQIILAAGDEDEDAFEDARELRYLPRLAGGVTVYHTRQDWILSRLSQHTKFNGPRLGVDGPETMSAISDKVVAVDVSEAIDPRQDFQSHQYYRIFPAVRDDIVAVLNGVRPGAVPSREQTEAKRYRILPARTAARGRRGGARG